MIKFLNKYCIESQIWVSLMLTALCYFWGIKNDSVCGLNLIIAFCSTLSGYNFVHFHRYWVQGKNKKFNFYLFFLGIFITLFLFYYLQNFRLLLQWIILCFIVLLYNSIYIPLKIRNLSIVKIFIISFVWTLFILFFSDSERSFNNIITVFLFVFGITLAFDISDLKKDKITTIPKLIGVKATKLLAIVSLIVSCLCFEKNTFFVPWSLSCSVSALFVLYSSPKRKILYTRFGVEFCSALPLLFYIVLKFFKIEIL